MPGKVDAEALAAIKDSKPDPMVYPHSFAWYAQIGKFSPEKQAAWK